MSVPCVPAIDNFGIVFRKTLPGRRPAAEGLGRVRPDPADRFPSHAMSPSAR